jgi:uncharacterized coiled-coil protein SlyX
MADKPRDEPVVTLREIHERMGSVEDELAKLSRHMEALLKRLDRLENPNLQNLSVPRDFLDEGPHFPGMG